MLDISLTLKTSLHQQEPKLISTDMKQWQLSDCILIAPAHNKIPLKRDASGPEGYSDTGGLDWELCIV